jgi:hypothetical protein
MNTKIELLDYAEKAGVENLKFRLQTFESLSKDANSTLTYLLAGIGGSAAFAANAIEKTSLSPITFGSAVLAVWLMLISFLLVVKCIKTDNLQTPTNEPMNLYQPHLELNVIRENELKNLGERIFLVRSRNQKMARWLDHVRILAITSPVVFALSAWAWGAR